MIIYTCFKCQAVFKSEKTMKCLKCGSLDIHIDKELPETKNKDENKNKAPK